MKRVLIVGNWKTIHIKRFLSILTKNKEQDLIIDAYDPCYEIGQGNDCGVDNVYRLNVSNIEKQIFSIRKLGTYFLQKRKVKTLGQIIKLNHYDLVNFHFVPINIFEMVKVCKGHHTKVLLTPLGSDVLRVKNKYKRKLKRAFSLADFVSFNTITGFCKDVSELYEIPKEKIVNLGYGSETISSIIDLKGRCDRTECFNMLPIPYSNYNIVCGYNASVGQRQESIFMALIDNIDILPAGYQIIFPLSYGNDKDIIKRRIIDLNKNHNLNIVFIEDYLETNQVAALRLITDLFIHVQITDAYNASLQEFLLAGSKCINGSWLKYPSLEFNGEPYIVCKTIYDLSDCVRRGLMSNGIESLLHKDTEKEIISNSWSNRIMEWKMFFIHL